VTRAGLRLTVLSLVAWSTCFVVLRQTGNWMPFAFVGVFLAAVGVATRAVPRVLLRPTPAAIAVGTVAGALMVLFTHVAYLALGAVAPSVRPATAELLALLNAVGFSDTNRAILIVVIASCEEVLFRGPGSGMLDGFARPHWPVPSELSRLLAFAVVYALTTAPLGSPLLVVCALLCGSLWGVLRVATGSLIVPILAHVLWDLGVLLVWPLSPP
jgi:membrane protease YdiL (CAAX protease family)